VPTKDGYLLELHRIPYGKNPHTHDSRIRKKPVILAHGNFQSSADWVLNSDRENSLGNIIDLTQRAGVIFME